MAGSTTPADDYSAFAPAGDDYSGFAKAEDDYSAFAPADPEVTAREAQNAATGAVQALDVIAAPRAFDWSDARERIDAQRLQESRTALARAKIAEDQGSGTGPGSEAFGWRREAQFQQGRISPDTAAGRTLAQEGQADLKAIQDVGNTAERASTPSQALSSFLGPGASTTVLPIAEGAARGVGGATGGAAGAAIASLASTGAMGPFPMILGIGASVLGSMAGGNAQEAILQTTETPEETQARQQRAAEDYATNPGLSKIGSALAVTPFFGPSLAQFGRAAAGDAGAIRNIALGGALGGGVHAVISKARGEEIKPEDLAEAIFMGSVMNEPTRLGRAMGLHPSSEQKAVEEAQAKYGAKGEKLSPIERPAVLQSDLTTEPPTSTADAFAGVQRATPEVPPEPIGPQDTAPAAPAPDPVRAEAAKQGLEYDGPLKFEDEVLGQTFSDTTSKPGTRITFNVEGEVTPEAIAEAHAKKLEAFGVKPTETAEKPKRPIRAASIRLKDGTIIDAPSHAFAYDKAAENGLSLAGVEEGFTLQNGDFIHRDEALRRFGGSTTEDIKQAQKPSRNEIEASDFELLQSLGAEPPPEVSVEPTVPPAEPPPSAPAAEAAPLPEGATSNKEAVVNAERAARNLDSVIKEARISNADSIDRAQTVIEQNPLKPQEIVARLRDNPQERTISLEDSAVLLVERTKLNQQREELLRRANDESLSATEQATAKAEFEGVETRLNELDQAAQDARSTWGRFGQLWQRSMRQDFTLEPLLQRARLAKGEALTAEESAKIKTIADEVAAKQTEADAAVQQAENKQIEHQVEQKITEIAKQPDVDPAVKSLADRIIEKLDRQALQARKNLRELFGKQLNALGPLDPRIIKEFTILAASRIAKASIKVGQWTAEMVKEWGEQARPYAEAAYNAANAHLDELVNAGTGDRKKRAAVKSKVLDPGQQQDRITSAIAARIKDGEKLDDLGRYVDKLTEAFVRGGIKDRTSLVAAVKGVLESFEPGISDRKVGELISGYGKATLLSKDPVKVVKRDLKGQLQQISKLEALAAKEPLKKTGPERRTQSDEERRLIKEVNAAKKEAGVVTTDPETQLKSTMDAARTRFANEIKDLTFQIDTGTRPPNKTPIQYDQDIEVLRGLRDRLKATVRDLDGPKQMTDEQRIRITTRGLQDSISALEARLAGAEAAKPRRSAPDTPEIRALKAKRDALKEQVNEVNAADALLRENRKAEALVRSIEKAEAELAGVTKAPAAQQGPESELVSEARQQLAAVREQLAAKREADPAVQQAKMDAAEAAVEKAIKKLDEQLQAGDLTVQRAPSKAVSQRLEDLRLQRDAMNRLRNQLRIEARPKPNPLDVAIKARKSQLARQEADYQARIAAGDFGPRVRKEPNPVVANDSGVLDANARVRAAKEEFAKLQKEWKWGQLNPVERTVARLWGGWQAAKNSMFAFDLSAPLQLAFSMAAHPIEGSKAIGKGVVTGLERFILNTNKFAERETQRILDSPNYKNGVFKEGGLDLTIGSHEENAGSVLEGLADLNSRWLGLPKIMKGLLKLDTKELVRGGAEMAKAAPKVYGMGIKASNEAYNVIANHMRARTFDLILDRFYGRNSAPPTKLQLKLIGELVNTATGRGGLKGETMIQKILYAPNYYLSLVKQLTGVPLWKSAIKLGAGKPATREIAEEYVRAIATVATLQGLVYLFGNRDKQTLDPRSRKFGRLVTDKGTEVDATVGRGAYITLAAQIAPNWMGGGKAYDKNGKLVKRDKFEALLQFAKGRLSREISTGLTAPSGEDFRGKPQTALQMAKDQLVPLSWRDVDKVLKREGLTRGSFIQMLNLLGVNSRVAE